MACEFHSEIVAYFSEHRPGTAVPLWWEMKYHCLMKGPHDLSNDEVQVMIQDLVTFGVCEEHVIDENVTIYTSLAGLLSRFVTKNIPVPFVAFTTMGEMMYECGGDGKTSKTNFLMNRHFAILAKNVALENVRHDPDATSVLLDSHFPSNTEEVSKPPIGNEAKSNWSENR